MNIIKKFIPPLCTASVAKEIKQMISEQEQLSLKYKQGSPFEKRCKIRIEVLNELANRLDISI